MSVLSMLRVAIAGVIILAAMAMFGSTPAPLTSTGTATPASPAASPGASPVASPVAAVQVSIKDFKYDPPMLEIPVGTTVTWTNNDSEFHTATGLDGEFETGTIKPGESASITFDKSGTYVYVCQFHANMKATIVVK